MRTMLTVAAVVVFVVSAGLLEITRPHSRSMTALPPAMGEFVPAAVDRTVTSSIETQRLDER
jgi:hypothetical protein